MTALREYVESLPEATRRALLDELRSRFIPQPHQRPPAGDGWTYWLMVAGRGSGKTDAGAEFVVRHARGPACIDGPIPHRIAIAAPTLGDARLTCVKGDSGIQMHDPDVRFVMTDGELVWPNGAHGRIFGAFTPEDVERWRGPQHCLVWADEMAAWRQLDECWRNMRLGLRLGAHPRVVVTTTGKPRRLLKSLMARRDAVVTTASTRDNPHLAQAVRDELYDLYAGTRWERQELGGEVVDEVDGAPLSRAMVEALRDDPPTIWVGGEHVPHMRRVVVAVDPAATSGPDADETGIVVDGVDPSGMGWVLDDVSLRGTPTEWASAAVRAYHAWRADRIVAEANNGGEMVELTIRTVDPTVPVKLVHASVGKRARAEPVIARYEQGRIRHRRGADLATLEDQLTRWVPGSDESPDHMDAHVWGITELMLAKGGWGAVSTVGSGVA